MNRDTYHDVPYEHAAQNILALKVKYETSRAGGQHRQQHNRQRETKMNALMQLYQTPENPITTTRILSSTPNARAAITDGDLRRNLYILGLPFDLTKAEFTKIFEAFGTVSHAVILATLDSTSRRRGFVVMGSHQEARAAMDSLSRTQIKGHILDVSWAVIQRSQGFLDGPDRTMMLAISAPSSVAGYDDVRPEPDASDIRTTTQWNITPMLTAKLLVSNLPALLFTQVSDLHPLLYPFGPIKDVKFLGSRTTGPLDGTVTAMVEYVNASSAQEAKDALQLQSYAGYPVQVHYICDVVTSNYPQAVSLFPEPLPGRDKSSDTGLNPFAPPFNTGYRFTPLMYDPRYNPRFGTAIPSGLPGDAPLAPRPFPVYLKPYVTDAISRSSSATSSNWSHDGRPFRPSRISSSSFSRAGNPSTSTLYAQDN